MSYYGQGDYYGRGGILDFAKKAVGTIARGAVGFVTGGPLGAVSAVLPRLPSASVVPQSLPSFTIPTAGGGVNVTPSAILPGGVPFLSRGRRRRRINAGNIKALKRAVRRQDAFVSAVRTSLKHTNYTLVTKGSRSKGKSKGNVFVETGAGGIRA